MDNSFTEKEKGQALDERPLLLRIAFATHTTLAMIFDSIDPEHVPMTHDTDNTSTKKISRSQQLFYLALTCKAFSEPALDILWKSMTSISPLLQILPVSRQLDEDYMMDMPNVSGGYMLTRKVEAKDIERFHAYAQRIRILTLTDSSALAIGPLVLMIHNKRLLPKLEQIRFSSSKLLAAPSTPFIISDSLRYLELGTSERADHAWIRSFLHTLPFMASDLQHLVLPSLPEGTEQEVLSFRNLRSLRVSEPLRLSLFRKLAILPGIRTLTVDLKADESTLPDQREADPSPIPPTNLETLCMAGNYTTILALLKEMRGDHLKHVDVTMRYLVTHHSTKFKLSKVINVANSSPFVQSST
ncbi:hypothetical protein C0995_009188 [Termitomyces sp. Mi166|nr:hypothetical protein C0995_009188 [Termitomyces sp. Mi166\